MKHLVVVAIMAIGLYGVTSAHVRAGSDPAQVLEHHNSQHSLGPCGINPCPQKPKDQKAPKPKGKAR